ncbi:MAG: hypothetical protein R8G66_25045 [Cytophagales bacterium]|nr:hypothetical protein [Cytophagales bacterium]
MKTKFFITLFMITGALTLNSCTEEEIATVETLEDRVNNAAIIPGEIPFFNDNVQLTEADLNSLNHLYIAIPGKNGYLKIERDSREEKERIVELVYQRFEKEFKEARLKGNQEGRTEGCTDWVSMDGSSGNSGYIRMCLLDYGVLIETCSCPYCCD